MQPVPKTVAFKVAKDTVSIKRVNPVMEHLVVEFVKTQLLVALMKMDQVNLLMVDGNATKSQVFTLFMKPG